MYKETRRIYSNIHKGGYPLNSDGFLPYSARGPRLLFNENDPNSGVIESFHKAFSQNPKIIEARENSVEQIRQKQWFFKRYFPLKGLDLLDSKTFSFEQGNFGYVVSANDVSFKDDHLYVVQIAKYREMPYYRIEFQVDNHADGSRSSQAEISYKLYETLEDYAAGKAKLSGKNTRSCMQVALKLIANMKRPDAVNYSFTYN
jgi:hypothetical protein